MRGRHDGGYAHINLGGKWGEIVHCQLWLFGYLNVCLLGKMEEYWMHSSSEGGLKILT